MKKERLIEMCEGKRATLLNEVNRGLRTADEAINVFGGYVVAMNDISKETADKMLNNEMSDIFVDATKLFMDAEAKRAEAMLREEAFDRVTYDEYGNAIKTATL